LPASSNGHHQKTSVVPRSRIPEALDRLIEFSTATNKPDEAAKWRAERAKYPDVAPMPREEN
jgi:hypothetical protein